MSNQPTGEDRYFKCDAFAITMPVSECSKRRNAPLVKNPARDVGGENLMTNRHMTRQCATCTVFEESLAKSITKEEMLANMKAVPAQTFNDDPRKSRLCGTLRVPHKSYGLYK